MYLFEFHLYVLLLHQYVYVRVYQYVYAHMYVHVYVYSKTYMYIPALVRIRDHTHICVHMKACI